MSGAKQKKLKKAEETNEENKGASNTEDIPLKQETNSLVEVSTNDGGTPFVTKEQPATVTSCQVWVKVNSFIGRPKRQDFRLITEEIPKLEEGEILVEAMCWNVEDYMRTFDVSLGSGMIGDLVGSVIATRNPTYPLFSLVICPGGWRTHAVVDPEKTFVQSAWNLEDHPVSLCLTTLGLPGLMAYFVITKFCRPQPRDVVLVNAAASSVGNVVAQIARIMGCAVIAFSSSKPRCSWLNNIGFDCVNDASTVRVDATLRKVVPYGVDCYIDCVGGTFTEQVMGSMKADGRTCVCGFNSSYAATTPNARPLDPYRIVYIHHGRVRTASVMDFKDEFPEALQTMFNWIVKGKIKYKENLYSGFEKLPEALAELNDGSFVGNYVVRSSLCDSLKTAVVEYSC